MGDRTPNAAHESGFVRHSRRSYHLHASGVAYLTTTLFLAIGGFNSQNNLLFWAFGVAVAGLIVSGVVSGAPLMKMELSRPRPQPTAVGEQLRVRYHLRNTGRWWPAFAMQIDEQYERRRPVAWIAGLRTSIGHVGPGETATAVAQTPAHRRGVHELRTVRVSTTFPLGLVRKCLYFDLPQQVIVRPRVMELRSAVRAKIVPGLVHTAQSRNRLGTGDEFFALREYQPGDPMRRIAWKASARGDTLMVRQNAAPAPPRMRVRVDAPPAGLGEDAFENTLSLVASVIVAAGRDRLAPGLEIGWAGISLAPSGGAIATDRSLDALASVEREDSGAAGASSTPADLVVTFVPAGAPGALCGADTTSWAAEASQTLIRPSPRRRPLWRLTRRHRAEVTP